MNRAFYKYDFVSPEPIFAKIKEELRSYYATGAIDDVLFPTWTDKCLRKLGKASLPIVPYVMQIEDYIATLPNNFVKAREVWACERVKDVKYKEPSSIYRELTSKIYDSGANACIPVGTCNPSCDFADEISVIYKTNSEQVMHYHKQWLLIPGNVNVRQYCSDDCFNLDGRHEGHHGNHRQDTFDIHGNKIVTTFRKGHIFMLYYSSSEDSSGNQLIPDNYRVEEYIEAFIKYKLFEQLSNQTTDETFNQIDRKLMFYKQAAEEAYVMMDIESKKKTTEEKFSSINRTIRKNAKYIIR